MSAFSFENFADPTDTLDDYNIWDAAFKDIHIHVPVSEVITIDARWEANLPGLAAAKLGSRYLWWAIGMFNGLYDPLTDMRPGMQIRIPETNALRAYLQFRQAANAGANYVTPGSATVL